jgi:Ca2+-binding RTX toxin-like protein
MRSTMLNLTITSSLLIAASGTANAEVLSSSICRDFYASQPPSSQGNLLTGTNAAETVFLNSGTLGPSTTRNDAVIAQGGDDRIFTNAGDDCIDAGDGNDEAGGGAGQDNIFGGDGNDELFGSFGGDNVFGNNGNDRMFGGDGVDILDGGAGFDTIFGGQGDDIIFNGEIVFQEITNLRSQLFGGEGNDTIHVSAGNGDLIYGGQGDDTVIISFTKASFSSENSRTIEIIDHEGNNQVQFENMFFNDLNFSRAEGKTNIYDAQSKVLIATISDQANSTYRFADTEVSAKEMESLTQ